MSYSNQDLGTQKSGGLLTTKNITTITPKAFPEAPKNSSLGSIYKTGANSYGDGASLGPHTSTTMRNDAMATQNASARQWSADRSAAGGRPFVDHAASMHSTPMMSEARQMALAKSELTTPQTTSSWANNLSKPSQPADTSNMMYSNVKSFAEPAGPSLKNQTSGVSFGGKMTTNGELDSLYPKPTATDTARSSMFNAGYEKGGLLVTPSTSKIYGMPYYN